MNGRKPRGLEITLDGAKYTRLIVSLDHPDDAKTALTAWSGSIAEQHPQLGYLPVASGP